jgi:hypothetical protein
LIQINPTKSFYTILKVEFLDRRSDPAHDEARAKVFQFLEDGCNSCHFDSAIEYPTFGHGHARRPHRPAGVQRMDGSPQGHGRRGRSTRR